MAPTVGQFLQAAATRLAPHSPTARLDAEVLVMHVCGLSRAELVTHAEIELCPTALGRLQTLLARREAGGPLAYLTGMREFWSLPLRITVDVLIPRPETELLVERTLAHIPPAAGASIADLGTGSGAVAIAIAHERPHCRVVATDVSAAALDCARDNMRRHGVTNVELREGEWCAALGDERFDVIVSNPPYVCEADPHLTQGDVRFEPRRALVAGKDGLDAVRAIAAGCRPHLAAGGTLLLEHGQDQGAAVARILRDAGFRDIVVHRDLAGLERVTEARRPT